MLLTLMFSAIERKWLLNLSALACWLLIMFVQVLQMESQCSGKGVDVGSNDSVLNVLKLMGDNFKWCCNIYIY
jgi:hypothetical protein